MRVKRLISGLLAAALLAGLVTLAPASAAGGAAFTDIKDSTMANAAETLRVLGVVDGTGGTAFNPNGTLTRAEFCKMAVEILGRGDEEPAQRNRTIFTDVGPDHWARGYVNLAASITVGGGGSGENATAGTRLIMGVGDGSFQPNRAITYGEAVTMLMRMLNYSDKDVASGSNWYDGYVGLAISSGLSDGLNLSGSSTLTRGQAAILFYNLLFTKLKGSETIYLTNLGGSLEKNVIVLSTDATAEDGTSGSVLTTSGTYKTDRGSFGSELCGTRGQIVLDKNDKLLAILPEEEATFRSVTVMGSPEANSIPVLGGEKISVTLSTPVYRSDNSKASTYEAEWTSLRTGTNLVVAYNGSGKLDYIYMSSGKAVAGDDNVMVAKNKPNGTSNPFTIMTGGKTPQIYKNGAPAEVSDIRQYDVGTYDKNSNTLFISDLKLCGLYENAYPNTAAPSKITVMGATLEVLPNAAADLSAFKVGEKVTFLLTTTGQVAGAVSPSVAQSNAVGVASIQSGSVSIKLLDGILTLTGKTTLDEQTAQQFNGYLVNVSSYKEGYLSLSKINGGGATGSLNLTTGKLGTKTLSPGVRFFEQVGNSALVEIERRDITVDTIPANKITYVGYDWAGRVDKLVLDDVTGDRYTYGMIYSFRTDPQEEGGEGIAYYTVKVENGSGTQDYTTLVSDAKGGKMGGIIPSLDERSGHTRLVSYMALQSAGGILRSQFDVENMVLTTNEIVIPIADGVQCYNKATGKWFEVKGEDGNKEALKLALAFSNNLTVYYDRSPEEGGKIRVVVAE